MSSFISLTIVLPVILTSARPYEALDDSVKSPAGVSISHLRYLKEASYGLPDNRTGERVAEWHARMGVNPEELGSYFEGDILFPPITRRNGLIAANARWPNGIVPFVMSPYFNAEQRKVIYDAMNDFHKYTCIRFKQYRGEEDDYIRITAARTGCWSAPGRVGGWQDVNLQVPGCLTKKGIVIHELMHAIGFMHEQGRYDRDNFVSIQWSNVKPEHAVNFKKDRDGTTYDYGVGYDYGSVMHYSSKAFTKNGQRTIIPKKPVGVLDLVDEYAQGNPRIKLGQREGFSRKDILKIRRMYKCSHPKDFKIGR